MNEIEELDSLRPLQERAVELKKKKRANLDKMKRVKRMYVKAKLEKKRINREIKKLQAEWQERIKKNPAEAKSAFAKELKSVTADDMFPKDLETEFDKLDLQSIKKGRTMKTEDLSKDTELKSSTGAVEAMERELTEDMQANDSPESESMELDDDTKAQLDEAGAEVGLTEGDIFIDDNGDEREVTGEDEKNS